MRLILKADSAQYRQYLESLDPCSFIPEDELEILELPPLANVLASGPIGIINKNNDTSI